MGIAHRTRLFASLVAIAALLFAQLAVSGYPCPMMGIDGDGAVEMNANLCERHCDYGNASLDQAKGLSAAQLAVQSEVRLAPVALPAQPQVTARTLRDTWPATGPAPPLIRFTVLRI